MPVEIDAPIKEIIQRTYNVKSFRLDVPNREEFLPGQYLVVTLKNDKNFIRALSISSSPTEKGYIEFTKKITASDFSKTLDSLKSGDVIKIRYPMGQFVFNKEYKKIAFISGGIGITPIRSMCKFIADTKADTDVVLLYGNRTENDIVFKEDFDGMLKGYQSLKVTHILSDASNDWCGLKGCINKDLIKKEIPDYAERKIYICGPPPMVEAMKKMLREELFLSEENVITERFMGY